MADMKTLTINGVTYTVMDEKAREMLENKQDTLNGSAGQVVGFDENGNAVAQEAPTGGGSTSADAVLYTPQTLTEAQKTQARTNIGAGVPVSIDTSLSTPGAAADAYAVGQRLQALENNADDEIGTDFSAMIALPGSLKWDGVIGSRPYVSIGEEYGMVMAFVHIYDDDLLAQMFSSESAVQVLTAINQNGIKFSYLRQAASIGDGSFLFNEVAFYIPSDNFVSEELGLTFPKRGIYFYAANALPSGIDMSIINCCGLVIQGYNFPDQGGGDVSQYFTSGSSSGIAVGETLEWDGDTAGYVVAAVSVPGITDYNFEYVRVSSSTPTVDQLNASVSGSNIKFYTESNDPDVQAQYTEYAISKWELSADGSYAFCYTTSLNGGSGADLTPVIVYSENADYGGGIIFPSPGVYLIKVVIASGDYTTTQYAASITVPGCNFIKIVPGSGRAALKPECLPETLYLYINAGGTNESGGTDTYIYKTPDFTADNRMSKAELQDAVNKSRVMYLMFSSGTDSVFASIALTVFTEAAGIVIVMLGGEFHTREIESSNWID